ncbi:MAG: U32 family peptidase [Erysipelotrichaceae bacterium]|jgi:putative protease|nr:U32 family peptidase [Erysipelotrichaceae bacterium]
MSVELLAPAGNLSCLKLAVSYGADAVYIGIGNFSLRNDSTGFSERSIIAATRFAHRAKAKVYGAINFIPHDSDFKSLTNTIKKLERLHLDGVICASAEILRLVKKNTKLPVFISTQQSVLNSAAIAFWKSLGADRVILGRELSIDQIKRLCETSEVELECFIHGGMCTNLSGRCHLSHYYTKRDANRGYCAQPCRWIYQLQEENGFSYDEIFTMGAMDLCAISLIPELLKTGVSSLKIEGRMKSEYYIAACVHGYRSWIDANENQTASESLLKEVMDDLDSCANRPAGTGFLEAKEKPGQIYPVTDSFVNHRFLGIVKKIDKTRFSTNLRNPLRLGEEVTVMSPKQPLRHFIVEKMTNAEGEEIVECHQPMSEVRLQAPFVIPPYSMIRRRNT